MINFWTDPYRFHPLVTIGHDTIYIHEYLRANTPDSLFTDGKRDPSLNPDFHRIKFNDVRINIKILVKGYRI